MSALEQVNKPFWQSKHCWLFLLSMLFCAGVALGGIALGANAGMLAAVLTPLTTLGTAALASRSWHDAKVRSLPAETTMVSQDKNCF